MKKACLTCAGSGQTSYFKGVSRFLLSWEECPECSGTGYLSENSLDGKENNTSGQRGELKKKKKRGGRKK